MGNNRFNPTDWDSYADRTLKGKTISQVFTATQMADEFNPMMLQLRESRDSDANPNSTPIIIGADVTGSMGMTAQILIQSGIAKVADEIYKRKPVRDPHILVAAIGDVKSDNSPLQVTQFEAGICLADQVKRLHVESGGGGNGGESYNLLHVFAGKKTVHDNWIKRRKKGYLFTIGDEPCHKRVTSAELAKVFGPGAGPLTMPTDVAGGILCDGYTAQECVALSSKTYEVFHIALVNEGYCRGSGRSEVLNNWNNILPQRVIQLEDMSLLAETIVSTIQVIEGANKATVAGSWGRGTDVVIRNAIKDIVSSSGLSGAVRL